MQYVSRLLKSASLILVLIQPYTTEAKTDYIRGSVNCRHIPREQRYDTVRRNIKSIVIPEGQLVSFGVTFDGYATYVVSTEKDDSEKEAKIHEIMKNKVCPVIT